MRVVIIVPTYNERENIGPLIEALQVEFEGLNHDMRILVVDDESPDGTSEVVREKQRVYSNVHLILGRKKGLGAAYIRGMRHATDHLGADVVFEMDADFSHKPEDVPRLMAALEDGADFVIGSRYVKGGRIPDEWGFHRRMISRCGNLAARCIAGLYRVKDCTAGFRAIRKTVIDHIDWSVLTVQGYAFQIALLNQAVIYNAVVKEIPVEFINRTHGESKLGLSDILEFIVNVWWIRLHNSKTFLKFGAVGVSGILVNLSFFTLFLWSGLHKYLASPLAIEMSVLWNFWLHNVWTFGSRDVSSSIPMKCLKFNLVSLGALVVSYSSFVILSIFFPAVSPQIHQLIGIIPGTLVNYFMNSYWTFAERNLSIGRRAEAQDREEFSPDSTIEIPGVLRTSDGDRTVHGSFGDG